MSSPGGGTKNKLEMQTFYDLQTTPKILFIISASISILGLIGALVGGVSAESDTGKAASALIGGLIFFLSGYWSYNIFTDKKNLKTCNTSFWIQDSAYTYAKPARDPDSKNISVCDAQKKAEYDNEEYKWFVTEPSGTGSNVNVWFFTEKAITLTCPGPCTLYKANSTTTKRKSDAPSGSGCSGGGQRSPGSSPGGGGAAGGGGGACASGQKSKGSSPRCPLDTTPNCHDGGVGKCCSDTATGCANNDRDTGLALSCNTKTFADTGVTEKRCCTGANTVYSQACATASTSTRCVDGTRDSCCGDTGECDSGLACKKPGNPTSVTALTPGKCCAANEVIGPDGNCVSGLDGTNCNNGFQCASDKACVPSKVAGTSNKCCPVHTPAGGGTVVSYDWWNAGAKCIAPLGLGLRAAGEPCNGASDCASTRGCGANGFCTPDCTAPTVSSARCGACVNPTQQGSCCATDEPATCGTEAGTGAALTCSNAGTNNPIGICCPSGKQRASDNTCKNSTNRPDGEECYFNSNCSGGKCWNATATTPGTCGSSSWGCRTSTDCSGSTPFCSPDKRCVECHNGGQGVFAEGCIGTLTTCENNVCVTPQSSGTACDPNGSQNECRQHDVWVDDGENPPTWEISFESICDPDTNRCTTG